MSISFIIKTKTKFTHLDLVYKFQLLIKNRKLFQKVMIRITAVSKNSLFTTNLTTCFYDVTANQRASFEVFETSWGDVFQTQGHTKPFAQSARKNGHY